MPHLQEVFSALRVLHKSLNKPDKVGFKCWVFRVNLLDKTGIEQITNYIANNIC